MRSAQRVCKLQMTRARSTFPAPWAAAAMFRGHGHALLILLSQGLRSWAKGGVTWGALSIRPPTPSQDSQIPWWAVREDVFFKNLSMNLLPNSAPPRSSLRTKDPDSPSTGSEHRVCAQRRFTDLPGREAPLGTTSSAFSYPRRSSLRARLPLL